MKQQPLICTNKDKDNEFHWNELSFFNKNFQRETKEIIKLGVPISISLTAQFIQFFTNQAIVGHLGTEYLASTSLASVIMSISISYIFGFCSTINVLSSQAYGAKNYKLVSEWYQLGCFLALILSIPTFLFYYFCDPILYHLFGASKHISHLAGRYAKWSMLSILPQTQFLATGFYFEAQSNVTPITVVCSCMIVFNLIINLILVYGFVVNWFIDWNGLRFIGSPIATSITAFVQYIIYVFYMFIWKKHHQKTWSKLNWNTFSCHRIKKFVSVGIPQTISQALEEWQLQIITLFTSKLDETSIAAFSTLCTVIVLCHCFAIGICEAIQVKVGNALGANKPNFAKYIAYIAIIIGLISGALIGLLLGVFGQYIAYIVSNSNEMYNIYKDICPMAGISFFMLSLLTVIVGVLMGQARVIGLAIVSIIGCWFVSVPLSYLLGIYWNIGDRGIFYGIICGYTVFTTGVVILFLKSNWIQCAIKAIERSEKAKKQQKDDDKNESDILNAKVDNLTPNIN